MDNRIVMISIAAVIGIIVLGSVLMPILDDATTTEETFTNNGLWRMKEIENGDVWSYSKTGPVITLNDVEQTGITSDGGTNWILGDTWCVRTNGNARGATISGSSIASISATAGEVNITFTGVTGTATQDLPGYGVDNKGDFTLKGYDGTAYLNGDSPIFATGQTTIDGYQFMVHVEGNINDGVTFTAFPQRNSTEMNDIVITNAAINYTAVNGYEDLYSFVSATCDIAFTTGSDDTLTNYSGPITYSSVVVPYEVSAERSVHFTAGQNAIFAAIPVMIILAVLLGVVALVIRSRMD